ncbi:hypothetical protein SAMN04487948_105332 [Halogranum amylolyticum]|uniref:Uncharacterized protein n=1 Tax=Halogranum amylolyticum TaxID=660520 RepID=A0A1H8STC2_9EURY|nr:hypothetical protein [Halogranum amylolyticum]SEO82219.1 hypothetical protein SAMN04487948_105332 [Halogranum amylolyticum]
MSESTSGEPDIEALRAAREEARETLDGQLSTLDDIDAKALSVFRLNVALVGVLLSALSVAATDDLTTTAAFVNPAVGTSVALFVLSAATAGLTYTTAGRQVGAGPAGLEDAPNRSERAFLVWLVDGYADWIRYNERANVRKALLATLAVLGTVAGVLAFGVGVLAAVTGELLLPGLAAVVVLAVLGAFANVPGQLRRLASERVTRQSHDLTTTGQRTFKGGDHER